MKKRIFSGFIICIIIFASLGLSYGCTNGFKIHGPIKYSLEINNLVITDNEAVDYCSTNHIISPDKTKADISFENAYPGYVAFVTYTLKNTGNLPITVYNLLVVNPFPEAISVDTQYFIPFMLDPHQCFTRTEQVEILDDAEQNQFYSFQIMLNADSDGFCPRSVGFWKQQFSDKNNAKFNDAVLESWLDAISLYSEVFQFTGDQEERFSQVYDILDPSKPWNSLEQLEAQLLTLWLNYVSGSCHGLQVNKMQAQDILAQTESAILLNNVHSFNYYKRLCEQFNTGFTK